MAFRWRADDGPLKVGLGFSLPPINLSKLDPLWQNFLDPRMNYVRRQFNFNRAGSHALHACADPEQFVRGGSERGPKCHKKMDHHRPMPGRRAQSVTCLATDACLTADPGVASSIPVRSHTFVEIDHEMISTVILLPSADPFKKGCCQLQAKVCARITG